MKPLAQLLDRIVFGMMAHRMRDSIKQPQRQDMITYRAFIQQQSPDQFFAAPSVTPALTESFKRIRTTEHYDVFDFHFPSAYTSPWPENNTVYGRYFKTKRRPTAPTAIVLHGWLAFSYVWFAAICRHLAKAGIHAVLIQLPYHMRRQPQQSQFSGQFTINGQLERSIEMIRQAVSDTRSVINWVKSDASSPVGVWGISLGGWVGAMVTALDARLDFSILMIPAVRPDDITWHSPLVPPLKQALQAAGITYEELEDVLKIAMPKYYRPQLPPDKILLMKSQYDLGIRPQTVDELWEAWGRPAMHSYAHSHMSIIFSRRVIQDGINFIRQVTG
ncbi:MAG: alpha/beta fold hydrolase [Acidobacteriota bacterium]|nr:alpha/beta fold hydrolase [Blastocatellia bacterium]MDW8239120.1 alpha/beta fold hydrolase [Acidobacteriota bacterium]